MYKSKIHYSGVASLLLFFAGSGLLSAGEITTPVELQKLPFFQGRDYFVLRSGRAEMVLQADRADLGPAFTYMLFDAENSQHSVRKEQAFNFDSERGCAASALGVVLGGHAFTALGHHTQTRWVNPDGLPAVEAVWWAGGIRVTERIVALADRGAFRRTIELESVNMVGEEAVTVRLAVSPGDCEAQDGVLLQSARGARLALVIKEPSPSRVMPEKRSVEIGPLRVLPGGRTAIETLLVVQVPAGEPGPLRERARALRDSLAAEATATRERWAVSSSVTTRDATVQDIFDKARFGLPGMMADDGTMNAGIFEYGAQWVRDTSNTALGALHAGHFELARATLVRMLTRMISKEGVTMVANQFDTPDLEQFDQMGELLHLLRSYRDWTGDDSLVREHRTLLRTLIERPLQPRFRDDTGMVHNCREFWERSFEDAYELAYQTYVILGLREAAELAPALGAEDCASHWRAEADRISRSLLTHPTRSLVHDGHLIKRRNITGAVADEPVGLKTTVPDVPMATEQHHRLMPDATMALPIVFRLVSPRSDLARRTLDELETLWNARWSGGGYERYHSSSQIDQPGPWTFATAFILRAQHEAGLYDRSRRSLEWLNTSAGGRTGAWFEEVPLNRTQLQSCGILPWTSGEIALFVVRHYLGVDFEHGEMVIRPALYPGSPPVSADLRYRKGRLHLDISGSGAIRNAQVNGAKIKGGRDGVIHLPRDFSGGTVAIKTRSEDSSKNTP